MRPIQKSLLIHSATLKTEVKDDWGKVESSTDTNLTYIRYEQSDKMVQTPTNQEEQLTGLIFYDIRHSRPRNVVFSEDMNIVFDGVEHRIVKIEKLYDRKKLHHLEIGVV